MNFEIIDNFFQVTVMCICSLMAMLFGVRNKDIRCLILSFSYASFMMGSLYYTLHIVIRGDIPRVFYVSEISWLAAYFFSLSLLIYRNEGVKLRFSLIPFLVSLYAVVNIVGMCLFGTSYFFSSIFAVAVGSIIYFALFRIKNKLGECKVDICLLFCVTLQIILYVVSWYTSDFTKFNLYFAIDILFTLSYALILPLTVREKLKK